MPLHTFTSPEGDEYEVSGPDGSTREQAFGILQEGIKTGYYKPKAKQEAVASKTGLGVGGYADASYQSLKRALTPADKTGHEAATQKTLEAMGLEKSRRTGEASSLDTAPGVRSLLGLGEVAGTIGTGLYDMVRSVGTGALKSTFGMVPDSETEANAQVGQQTYMPRTQAGQNILDKITPALNELAPFGPWGARAIVGLPSTLSNIKIKGKMGRTIPEAIGAETPPNTAREDIIRGKQPTPVVERPQGNGIQQMADQMLEGWNTPYRPDVLPEVKSQNAIGQAADQLKSAGEQQRAAKAQEVLALRQAAMEQEVARQTSLDQNAAQRARQEQAPTGYEQWREGQQQAAEQRLPGDNTPMNMESPYPADVTQFPQVLQDAPYKHEQGIPYDQPMLDQSLPIEVRDSLGDTTAPDPFNRYSPQQAANRILREGEHPPINKVNDSRINRFGQGGGILMDSLLPRKVVEKVEKWFKAGGRVLTADIDRMIDDLGNPGLGDDARQILITRYKDNDITPRYLARIARAQENNDFAKTQRAYKNLDSYLMNQLITDEMESYKNFTPEQEPYMASTGFHAPRDQARVATNKLINKFGQGGAIDPRVFEEMYNFGKSVVRGVDGLLAPVYHGTIKNIKDSFKTVKGFSEYSQDKGGVDANGWVNAPKRSYPGDLGAWFSSTPKGTDTFAGARTGTPGGNVHQVYLNLTNPKVFKTHGDFIDWFHSQTDKGQSANFARRQLVKQGHDGIQILESATDAGGMRQDFVAFHPEQIKSAISGDRVNKFGQGGQAPMIGDLAEGIVKVGRGLKAKFTGVVPPQPDTILTPRSPATIAAKVEKGSKAAAIGMKDSPYISPSTIEEVVANPGKDISRVTQEMGAGMYAAIRRNSPNRMMAFSNRVLTDARLNKIKDSVQYITGKEGYNNKLTKLSPKEKMIIHQDSLIFDREAIPFTHEKAVELGYTPAMEIFMNQRMASNGRVLELGNKVNAKQGLKLIDPRVSYAAANFDGAYRTLVGKWHGEGKNREFKIDTVVNGNSYWELRQGEAWARENVPGAEFLELPRRGLNKEPTKEFKGVQQDSMSRLLSELAGMDPKFADAKAAIDAHIELQTKKLYGHDKHAIEKKGVRGAIGNRPWLDAERNASDFFKQEVNHIEEGLQYWNYQDAINDIRSMTARPELGHMKNTIQYIDKYLQNIHGQGLNAFGAAINTAVDAVFASTGFGSASTSKGVMNAAREAASLWMMGMFNTAFPVIQLSQFLTGMAPEAMRIRSEFGLNPTTIATSLGNSTFSLSLIAAADLMGKPMDAFPSHLVDAYKWAKEHGITQYNEVEQSHSATQNPKWSKVKDIAGLPISVPERITGPQTFMWAVDMLHEAGLRGDDLHRAAYNASKYAMTEYHPDEAPLVYQRLGVAGPNIGGLKKFVHNSIDQQFARYGEAFKHPAAASTVLGMTLLTAGATGLMGTAMLDKASLSMTDKGLRDHWDDMMGTSKASQGVRDGFTSVLTGFDVQSRYSLADVVPGSFAEAVAGPHLSMLAKTATAILKYGLDPTEQSFREAAKAATPSGMKGMLEEGYMLGEQGQVLDKNAMNKYPPEMNRTPTEHAVRKYGGPKPLRERLYDEQKYQADVVQRKIEKKRSEAVTKLTASMGFKDPEGFKKAMTQFIEAEGDVSTLEQSIQKYYEQQMLSSKQRAGGIEPKASIPTIKKWERYQDK
jgi:hypothetical protein